MSKPLGVATNNPASAASSVPGGSKNTSKPNRSSSISTKPPSPGTRSCRVRLLRRTAVPQWRNNIMSTIELRTEIPGPKSRALMARREAAIPRGPANATPVFAARTEGAVIEDVDGNRYLDFAGGIGCLNAGHRSPRVLAVIREQLDKFLHLCFAVTPYEGYVAV